MALPLVGRLAIVLLVIGAWEWASAAAVARGQDKDAEYDAAMIAAHDWMGKRQYEEALRQYKKANAARDKTSAEAMLGMARAYRELEAFKSSADSCAEALKYVGDDKRLEAKIRNLRGLSLFSLSEKPDDKRLKEAETEFRAVLAIDDTSPIAHFNLGLALLRQGRDAEGLPELHTFIATGRSAPEIDEARRLVANPRRAREPFAPEFSITTLAGEHIALEDLRGRVVLLDFWATWCPPCVAATPSLLRLHKKYGSQPFTILGISVDRDKAKWRAYIEEEKMEWPQYLDNGRLARLYKLGPVPTYILIDHEGIIRSTKTGYGSSTDAWFDGEVRKYLKRIPSPATGTDTPALFARPGAAR